jgi:sugar phosphate isomerase/epimerase
MRNNPISLASGVVPEFPPPVQAAAALAAGFDAAGIWVEPANWTAKTTRQVRQALSGLPVLDVEVIWIKPGPANPDHFRILDIGAEIGARNTLVVSSDPDFGATAAKLAQLCEHVRSAEMRVALEFGLFTDVKTISDAHAIVSQIDHDNVALLVDPIHLSRSGGSPKDVAKLPSRFIAYAQFCDAPPTLPDLSDVKSIIHEAIDLRLLPGEGSLPLDDFLESLPAKTPLSIELRSKALRDTYPDATDRARAVAQATRNYLNKSTISGKT